jgi:tripartite-type tricarboxylate transporter receptor subunit TctC
MRRLVCFALGCAALLSFAPALSLAQNYPGRTVSVVVPYPPGGSVDGVARILSQKLAEEMHGTFIVENRAGGAGGIVGANYVAKAKSDGYTLLLTASIHVITPFLHKEMPYDVVTDFTPISLIASGPLIVSTAPNVPAKSLKEFFDLVRKDPSKYTFATSSFGSAGHLAVELLKREANVNVPVIAYRGAGPALTDLMGGQVQLMADPMLSSSPLAKDGKIKALAITSLKRVSIAPEIPTVEESGMKPLDFGSWYGLWGPKDMPADLVRQIQQTAAKVINEQDVKEKLAKLGFEPIGFRSDQFARYIKQEMARYQAIIKDADIKAQ